MGPRAYGPQWLWSTGLVAPWHVGIPGPVIQLSPLHWLADSQPLDHQGSPKQALKQFLFIFLLLAVLALCCYIGFSLDTESWGYSLVVLHGLLIVTASLVVKHRP